MPDDFVFVKRADIRPERQGPGATEKVLLDESGSHRFDKFVRVEIAKDGAEGGYYLFHVAADGSATDTWHATLEEALDQAEAEYGVRWEEWEDITS